MEEKTFFCITQKRCSLDDLVCTFVENTPTLVNDMSMWRSKVYFEKHEVNFSHAYSALEALAVVHVHRLCVKGKTPEGQSWIVLFVGGKLRPPPHFDGHAREAFKSGSIRHQFDNIDWAGTEALTALWNEQSLLPPTGSDALPYNLDEAEKDPVAYMSGRKCVMIRQTGQWSKESIVTFIDASDINVQRLAVWLDKDAQKTSFCNLKRFYTMRQAVAVCIIMARCFTKDSRRMIARTVTGNLRECKGAPLDEQAFTFGGVRCLLDDFNAVHLDLFWSAHWNDMRNRVDIPSPPSLAKRQRKPAALE